MSWRLYLAPALITVIGLTIGCGEQSSSSTPSHAEGDGHDHAATAATSASTSASSTAVDPHAGHDHGPSGVISLPQPVQVNLGITWATVEYRVVQGTLRLPGRFEAEPDSRRIYQSPLSGRVDILVRPYEQVTTGQILYRLHSHAWQDLQIALGEADANAATVTERLQAAKSYATATASAQKVWEERLTALQSVQKDIGGRAGEVAEVRGRLADLAVQTAEATSALLNIQREAAGPGGGLAVQRRSALVAQMSSLTGLDVATLIAPTESGDPLWLSMSTVDVHARSAGVVEGDVAGDGAWIAEQTTVMTVTDPTGVRLRASALQAHLSHLPNTGIKARIVASDPHDSWSVPVEAVLSPQADAIDRSVALIARPLPGVVLPPGVRPGVTALLEVVISGSGIEELALPVAATIRDGLETVAFRRDRDHPDAVERVVLDLGASDGRWVEVLSGFREGDQLVQGGIYPLKLSQQQGGAQAGHFEADGTFHTGSH